MIYDELKDEIYEDKVEEITEKIRGEIFSEVKAKIYSEVKKEIYDDEIDDARLRANAEYQKQQDRYSIFLEQLLSTYAVDIDFEDLAEDLAECLINYEWPNIENPIEVFLVNKLRENSDYIKDIEQGIREDLGNESVLKIVKNNQDIMKQLKEEFEAEMLSDLDASL